MEKNRSHIYDLREKFQEVFALPKPIVQAPVVYTALTSEEAALIKHKKRKRKKGKNKQRNAKKAKYQ